MASQYSELASLLRGTKVRDLSSVKDQAFVEFGKDDLIRDVHDSLVGRGILSAPVYDFEADKYLGLIDLRDIVAFVLSLYKKDGPFVLTAEKIVDFSGMNEFKSISPDASLLEAMEIMQDKNLHRLAIMQNKSRVWKILSQSDIVLWIFQNKAKLGDILQKKVGELQKVVGGVGGIKDMLLSVKEGETVAKAFETMQMYNVHGVPVVNNDGVIIGNISVTDMKHIVKWELDALNATCKEFFEHLFTDRPAEPITCTLESTFGDVVTLLIEKKIHRTYVVDKDHKPVDIITLSNIIDTILSLANAK